MATDSSSAGNKTGASSAPGIESVVRQRGEQILTLMDAADAPSLFSRKGFYGALMDWSMRDEHFRTQLFRFVDVLPMLNTSSSVSRHLKEYLDKEQVTGLARQFMLGNDEKEIVATLRKLHEQHIAFTVDVLGEAVVSEPEAD